MGSGKYNKVLTVVLIIVIIAVIGLLIFFGYDMYRKYYIEKETEEAVGRFEDQFNGIISNGQVTENTEGNSSGGISVDLNSIYEQPGSTDDPNGGSSSGGNRVQYKGYDVIGTIEIPKTKVKCPILNDVSIRALEASVGRIYPTSGPLNIVGNTVIVGHNYRNSTFFSNNKKLENGDKIYITDETGKKVTYVIYKKYETSPSDFEYANRNTNGKREISLSTCTDDTKKRLIIWAEEQ